MSKSIFGAVHGSRVKKVIFNRWSYMSFYSDDPVLLGGIGISRHDDETEVSSSLYAPENSGGRAS